MQNIEAPRPTQAVVPAPAGENLMPTPSTQTPDRTLVVNRNIGLRRRIGLAGAGLVLAATSIGGAASFGNRASAQGAGESPAPSVEPAPSMDPNGGTATGEECDPGVVPVAAQGEALAAISGTGVKTSPEPSLVVVVPAPSAPAGGDLVAGDPSGEACDPGPSGVEALNILREQIDIDEEDNGIKKTSLADVRTEVVENFWLKYEDILVTLNDPEIPTQKLSRDVFDLYLDVLKNGMERNQGDEGAIQEDRLRFSASLAIFLLQIRDQLTDPAARMAGLRGADFSVEYGLTTVAKKDKGDKQYVIDRLTVAPGTLSSE